MLRCCGHRLPRCRVGQVLDWTHVHPACCCRSRIPPPGPMTAVQRAARGPRRSRACSSTRQGPTIVAHGLHQPPYGQWRQGVSRQLHETQYSRSTASSTSKRVRSLNRSWGGVTGPDMESDALSTTVGTSSYYRLDKSTLICPCKTKEGYESTCNAQRVFPAGSSRDSLRLPANNCSIARNPASADR